VVVENLNQTFARLTETLPCSLRHVARELPLRLQLTSKPDATWEDFVQLEPNRDLPNWVVEDSDRNTEPFTIAHHCAAVFGILADRLADGQVARTNDLARLRALLLAAWIDALGRALDDERGARSAITRAMRAWQCGIAMERAAFRTQQLTPATYFMLTRLKLDWIVTSASCFVEKRWGIDRARRLRQCYGDLLVALQLRDDALDSVDDRRLHGADVATLLGVTPGALMRAAPRLILRAAASAGESGFFRLSEWMRGYHREADVRLPHPLPLHDELWGLALATCFQS
jgi:hypothetical protein